MSTCVRSGWAVLVLAGCAQLPAEPVPEPQRLQQPLVVVDIDGTLTPRVAAVSEPRPDAARALATYVSKGYGVAYVSARVPLLQLGLPDWLRRHGFPPGPLHLAQSAAERAHVDAFKAGVLAGYTDRGWQLAYAYGDSSSDFAAYARAGVPREHVFALRRQGDRRCQPGAWAQCLEGWTEHLSYVVREVPGTP